MERMFIFVTILWLAALDVAHAQMNSQVSSQAGTQVNSQASSKILRSILRRPPLFLLRPLPAPRKQVPAERA
jgi:hypothetical protein